MYDILKLNEISNSINDVFTAKYNVTAKCDNPIGIMLRSFDMHNYQTTDNLLAVARAGAGVNNIPIPALTQKGIAVFNTPGANANAVKELVLCAMLIASRKVVRAINWTKELSPDGNVASLVEKGKNAFVGPELAGKKLGVIGLGAIGRMVANSAINLDMEVLGYDPYISVDGAWSLSRKVQHVTDINEIFRKCDFISLHVPLTETTKNTICKNSIDLMKSNVKIINCSRGELVNDDDIILAIKEEKVSRYITDFPNNKLLNMHENIILIPHLGASTPEAEDNCAVMASQQLIDYIENGNVTNSVNFPNVSAPRNGDKRITILHKNVANMLASATSFLSSKGTNINNLVSSSRGDIAYMIIDIDGGLDESILQEMKKQNGFLQVRVL